MNSLKAIFFLGMVSVVSALIAVNSVIAVNVMRAERDTATEQLKIATDSTEKANKDFVEMSRLNVTMQIRLNETLFELEKMKGRESTVFAKPELVEKMIVKSFDEFEKAMSCATGSSSDCQ